MSEPRPAPLLVLGVGNPLLTDDGVGLELLERLRSALASEPRIEVVDGGTLGLALVGLFDGRTALVVLDAIRLGATPGTVHLVGDSPRLRAPRGMGAHGSSAGELLDAARLLGNLPRSVDLVGVEPAVVRTGMGLSAPVRNVLDRATDLAHDLVRGRLRELETREAAACTS